MQGERFCRCPPSVHDPQRFADPRHERRKDYREQGRHEELLERKPTICTTASSRRHKDIWKREQRICAARVAGVRARRSLVLYVFAIFEKIRHGSIDESYHRNCYSFKNKKRRRSFLENVRRAFQLIFERCTTERSKTFPGAEVLFLKQERTGDGEDKNRWSLEKLLKRVPKVSAMQNLSGKGQSQKDTEEKRPRNKKAVRRNEKIPEARFLLYFQSEPCSAGKNSAGDGIFSQNGADVDSSFRPYVEWKGRKNGCIESGNCADQ